MSVQYDVVYERIIVFIAVNFLCFYDELFCYTGFYGICHTAITVSGMYQIFLLNRGKRRSQPSEISTDVPLSQCAQCPYT